jgi:predicted nucleic acid-binding protein
MKKLKIYLDVCCYNRPFDDQTRDIIRLEAEAIIRILNDVQTNEYDVVGSEVIDYEISRMEDPEKKEKVEELVRIAKKYVMVDAAEVARASELARLGIGAFDALHLSCAEKSGADFFLTTDKRLLRLAEKHRAILHVRTANPLHWLVEETRNEY